MNRVRFCSFTATLLAAIAFAKPVVTKPIVTKVEPPNWWTHHTINPVRLLIRGEHLGGLPVTADPAMQLSNVRVNSRGTYLFVDVTIAPGAPPGSQPLHIGSATVPFQIDDLPPASSGFQGFSPDDVVYLIMIDRFANGDPSNDDPAISKGLFDLQKPRYYHGGDFQGIIDHLPYLKSLGVTALWLTPIYDNNNGLNYKEQYDSQPIADYHGYGAIDYYGVEEHFGTLALLRELVDKAHLAGLKVIQDQVANHVGPYHPWVKDPPTPSWFHGTEPAHSKETWQIFSLADPHGAALRAPVLDGWFLDILPDMNQEDPEVARYEIQNALWWLGIARFDGIRQDTLPYVSKSFWHKWSGALKRQYPNVRAVGEVFDADPALTSSFQGGESGIDTVFDFPAYFKIRDAFAQGGSISAVAESLAHDRLYPNPQILCTFLGNHDVERFMNAKGATVDGLKLAFTFLLTARGIPTIYYGDEIAMQGGTDPDNRRDMRFDVQSPVLDHVRTLTRLRASLKPLRQAPMITLSLTEQTWVYHRGNVVVAINNGSAPADVEFPWDGTLTSQLEVSPALAPHKGMVRLSLRPRKAEIYVSTGGS